MQNGQTDLQSKFDSLPEAIKDAITSVDFSEHLQTIGRNNGLHIDELDALLEEVGFVMLGETPSKDFPEKLGKRLNMTREKLEPLIKSVDNEIFQPIRTALMEVTARPSSTTTQSQNSTTTTQSNTPPASAEEADYNMSRDAILSEIENPRPAEVKVDYVPKRNVEATDPHEYLLQRKTPQGFINKPSTEGGKPSLAAEAVLVAEKKALDKTRMVMPDIDIATKPQVQVPPTIPITPQTQKPLNIAVKTTTPQSMSPSLSINPSTPSIKLSSVTQTPSTKTLVTPTPTAQGAKSIDPYREIV
jgi:hypothetical protein